MECFEMKVTYHDGEQRAYIYDTLSHALEHAVRVAAGNEAKQIEVWQVQNVRIFAYTNGKAIDS